MRTPIDPYPLFQIPGTQDLLMGMVRDSLLPSDVVHVLQSSGAADHGRTLAACWLVAKLAFPGVWPDSSWALAVELARKRLQDFTRDIDWSDNLPDGPELSDFARRLTQELDRIERTIG